MAGSTTKASTYDARIKDKPNLDFTLRFQGNALIENDLREESRIGNEKRSSRHLTTTDDKPTCQYQSDIEVAETFWTV